jgi:hypothetical protein
MKITKSLARQASDMLYAAVIGIDLGRPGAAKEQILRAAQFLATHTVEDQVWESAGPDGRTATMLRHVRHAISEPGHSTVEDDLIDTMLLMIEEFRTIRGEMAAA